MRYSAAFQMRATMMNPQSVPAPNTMPVKYASVFMVFFLWRVAQPDVDRESEEA